MSYFTQFGGAAGAGTAPTVNYGLNPPATPGSKHTGYSLPQGAGGANGPGLTGQPSSSITPQFGAAGASTWRAGPVDSSSGFSKGGGNSPYEGRNGRTPSPAGAGGAKSDDPFGGLISFGSAQKSNTNMSLDEKRRLASGPASSMGFGSLQSSNLFVSGTSPSPNTSSTASGYSGLAGLGAAGASAASPSMSTGRVGGSGVGGSGNAFVSLLDGGLNPISSTIPVSSGSSITSGSKSTFPAASQESNPFGDLLGDAIAPSSSSPATLSTLAASTKPSFSAPSTTISDPWNFDLLEKPVSSMKAQPATYSDDPFDLTINSSKPASVSSPPVAKPSRLVSEESSDDDGPEDPFGLLSNLSNRPKPSRQRQPEPTRSTPPPASPRLSPAPKSFSSPISQGSPSGKALHRDFEIAQIVDMGFDTETANFALDAAGGDLDMAIDILVKGRDGSAGRPRPPPLPNRDQAGGRPGATRVAYSRSGAAEETGSDILNKASAFGLSMFSHAKTALEFSKKKLGEAYEKASETVAVIAENNNIHIPATGASGKAGQGPSGVKDEAPRNYKPYRDTDGFGGGVGGYRNRSAPDSSDDDIPVRHQSGYERYGDHGAELDSSDDDVPLPRSKKQVSSDQPSEPEVIDLPWRRRPFVPVDDTFSTDATPHSPTEKRGRAPPPPPSKPSSAVRQKPPVQSEAASLNIFDTAPAALQQPAPVKSSPPPPPPTVRHASPEQIAESERLRELGNGQFKVGQFAEAESHYSSAISALPSNDSVGLIPLYNNRAAARLKTGNPRGAIEDCDAVQSMTPGEAKSLLRRATAWEALEKWEKAGEDYEKLLQIDPTMKGVSASLTRVKKALKVDPNDHGGGISGSSPGMDAFGFSAASSPKPKPPTAPKPMSTGVKKAVDKAVESLREQNMKAEAEEDRKFAAKETIDIMIERWRAGKENNLRALLSSLDSVLWKEMGWTTIPLSELITPQQVKIKYMKAVAKVHPDKLKPSTTVEQRMIANGVFSTLNNAWDSFKQQSGM
ncbi:hypothetical protein DFJ73DRAFT_661350 [Zopfochytrium polystomum]|nr:hypothetical protein DFJ73DRAFT_661350 [Zopfochytrium polystomum]